MKKLFTILLLVTLLPLSVLAQQSRQATLYNTEDGNRMVVNVGEWLTGDWRLETPTDNISYWVNRLKTQDEQPITDEEFDILPYHSLVLASQKVEQLVKEDEELKLGYSVVSRYKTRLTASMTSTQTTMTVASMETFDEHTLTMADLGSKVFLTIEPGGNKEEIVKATGISSSSWTGLTRGLAFYGTTETAVAGNRKSHNAGSVVIMSNVHYVYEQLPDLDTAQTIGGIWTFTNAPLAPTATTVATSSDQYATKYYVDNVGAGGFTSANVGTTQGLEALGTSPETVGIDLSSLSGLRFDNEGDLQFASSSSVYVDTDNTVKVSTTTDFAWTGDNTHSGDETFSGAIYSDTNMIGINASTTITGLTTPQPVYIATSTGALLLSSAASNATSTEYAYFGFAITSGNNGDEVKVQYDGIVDGFTGLTPGAEYYVQDTAGTIGTTQGTTIFKVGQAVSATELLIDREKKLGALSTTDKNGTTYADETVYNAYHDIYVYGDAGAGNDDKGQCVGDIDGTEIQVNASSGVGNRISASMFVSKGHTWQMDCSGTGGDGTIRTMDFN